MKMKQILWRILPALLAALLVSCESKTYRNINYIQDVKADTVMNQIGNDGILVQPKDMISIVVSHRTPQLAAPFNLTNVSYQAGAETESRGSSYRLLGYTVDTDGYINFPILGKLYVAGMNRWEVSELVRAELAKGLLSDAVVTVEYMNFKISVIGEVSRPGTFAISGDRVNLLEALSMAGDLTIYGRRDNVTISREKDGKRYMYIVDLRSSDLFNSPAFYLQQNDIVYVEPNSVRAGQSTINENSFRSVSFWVSIGSFLMTTANLLTLIIQRTAN